VKDYSKLKRNDKTGTTGETSHVYLLHKRKAQQEEEEEGRKEVVPGGMYEGMNVL